MQGEVLMNDWKVALECDRFDPKLGIGRVLIGSDGLPFCLIFIHVDDILLQGPTLTVHAALIYHPIKLKPPAQIHNFGGFLYDSVGTLKLRIPYNKVVRAFVLLEFLMRGSRTFIYRLDLAVLVGT
jgi:hypothetical protein